MIYYQPSLPKLFGQGLIATHKGITATLYPEDGGVLIYTIESKNEGQGECREFIQELKKDYLNLRSSIPLNEKWKSICKNYGIAIVND